MRRYLILLVGAACVLLACGRGVETIAEFPVDNLDGIIAQSNVTLDREITADGGGALRIEAPAAATIPLLELVDPDVEKATLTFEAKIRTQNLTGMVYLEMLCHFPERGEFFARGLDNPVTGDVDWSSQSTQFFLKAGENPDLVKLNIGVAGSGTIWVDAIKVTRGPLK
ncbi:MAG TPA: hypothetical protein PKW75_08465 [candidate division Zixibacteria bacterium]|nr:hypothetical protein [candidate division Zixibacteria bacterium]MDD4916746.1 hypothetical protein [candidate division Zixibacteria bacterium]MDM7973813.1 hypothetical protein [candidate division Zixibacteria bacterium]HOD65358.1 hypothetical protein [candidate division Zixibacteria bacterium]HOZ08305.1 hypothetical protein [candidate division Zixibacteria bacterium]